MEHKFLTNLNENLTRKPVEDFKNKAFAAEVASGKIKFLTVVESMQGILTNENVNIRQKGIEFLSWLLSRVPNTLFDCTEINVLVNFYCDCLKGHHNYTPPAVRGLLELLKMKQMTKEDVSKILATLFKHVNCHTQLQPDRLKIYLLLKFIIENYLEEVTEMGLDFVFGIISFIEGESDPFCLIHIFMFLPVFIKNFNLGHLSEEMFELLSCYFPIDFNASAKENISITREDLAEKLHQCLTASNSMSQQSIPLIIEKAESTSDNAKVDSYRLLKECCKNITVENIEKHLNQLWKCLSKDVLQVSKKEVSDAGLAALADIIQLLAKDESHEQVFFTFMDDILTTVKSVTNRVDENMFQSAIKVLVAVSTACRLAFLRSLHHLKTISQLESSSTDSEKKIILNCLLPFLKLGLENKITELENQDEVSCFNEVVTLYLNATTSMDYETRKLAFTGVLEAIPRSSQDFRSKLFKGILENITIHHDIRKSDAVPAVWRSLAEHYESELYEFVSGGILTNEKEPRFSNFMWMLSLIADLPRFTGYVIPLYMDAIDKPKYITVLKSFLNACKLARNNESISFFQAAHTEHNLIERLISWGVSHIPTEEDQEEKTMTILSQIVALLIRRQDFDVQQSFVNKAVEMFLRTSEFDDVGDIDPILAGLIDGDPTVTSLVDIEVFEGILGSVRTDVVIPKIEILREKLTIVALHSSDDCDRLASSRLLGTFVNKLEEELSLDMSSKISKDFFRCLEELRDEEVRINASTLYTMVMKGLLLRGAENYEEWVTTWFELLDRWDIGEAIADGFQTVIEEDEFYLNLDSYCNVKVLYRQKLFGNYTRLLGMYEMSDSIVRTNYLLALAILIKGVPTHLVLVEMTNILAIISRCLETEKFDILETTLEVLMGLLEKREAIFSEYVNGFVPKLLRLTKFQGPLKIRMFALRCLYFYGFYPTSGLLPIKNQVIRTLEACLDDRKRLARKEAVRARCRWFLVGAPGEDILDS